MPHKIKHPKAIKPAIAIQKRTAIYLRVSTEEQATEGFGLEVQRSRCQAQAIVKDWSVACEFADEGISGTKDANERPGLAALLGAIEANEIDAVIVLSLDRLGRKARITLDLVDRIVAAGVDLVSCKESLDTTTAAGRLVVGFFAIIAEWERSNIVERTTAGRDQRGKQDGEKGGSVPYGYRRARDTATGKTAGVEVDPPAAKQVRLIFALRRKRQSYRAIAAQLPEPGPRGGRWYASGVREIVLNEEAYRGGPRGESAIRWPAILS